uniref:Water stress and hypersensitive response domain-containing protein n=1 Tax=Anthurium amnicola TaxID=1678845 RepID=A0A1D1YLC0_9ARAE
MPTWSWTSALVGAATATALILGKPRDPTFHLISIELSSFRLNLPLLDVELTLTVHVTNPNIVPIRYSATTMSIFYDGSLLGSAPVQAGSQAPMSCQLLRLPARLDGLQLAHHATKLLADAARRHMALHASVDIAGTATLLCWAHRFSVHVDSHVVVDPVHLDVLHQDNRSETQLYLA